MQHSANLQCSSLLQLALPPTDFRMRDSVISGRDTRIRAVVPVSHGKAGAGRPSERKSRRRPDLISGHHTSDLTGKGGHVRTMPMSEWVKTTNDGWLHASGVSAGRLFRRVCRSGSIWGEAMAEKVVWNIV